jgi:acyl-CoA thioesterase II
VGDLDVDTAIEPVDSTRFRASVRRDWEIWGPMGGYVAALALRAAGALSPFARPASFACQYLRVAAFEPVELEVTLERTARTACAQRVAVTQAGRPILSAQVWSVATGPGLEHHQTRAPTVPDPEDLLPMEALAPNAPRPYPFWDNVESRPVDFEPVWPPAAALAPIWRSWARLRPTATFDDPWLDAARCVILLDVQSWPAAHRHHAWRDPPFIAPSLDLYVAFHEPAREEPWLLADGHAPTAADGLIGWTGRLWSRAGRLVASGGGQLLCRSTGPA